MINAYYNLYLLVKIIKPYNLRFFSKIASIVLIHNYFPSLLLPQKQIFVHFIHLRRCSAIYSCLLLLKFRQVRHGMALLSSLLLSFLLSCYSCYYKRPRIINSIKTQTQSRKTTFSVDTTSVFSDNKLYKYLKPIGLSLYNG